MNGRNKNSNQGSNINKGILPVCCDYDDDLRGIPSPGRFPTKSASSQQNRYHFFWVWYSRDIPYVHRSVKMSINFSVLIAPRRSSMPLPCIGYSTLSHKFPQQKFVS